MFWLLIFLFVRSSGGRLQSVIVALCELHILDTQCLESEDLVQFTKAHGLVSLQNHYRSCEMYQQTATPLTKLCHFAGCTFT